MLRGRRHDIAQFSLISIIGLVFYPPQAGDPF
jgi:hypothetical protein